MPERKMDVRDKRTFERAAALIAKGAKAPTHVRNYVKSFMTRGHGVNGTHEINTVTKWVDSIDKPITAKAASKNGSNPKHVAAGAKAKDVLVALTNDNRGRIARAIVLAEVNPPGDERLRKFLSRFKLGRTRMASPDMLRLVEMYIDHEIKRVPGRKPNLPGEQAVGLGLSTQMVMVTPEVAFDILYDNEKAGFKNRQLNKDRIARYAADMKSGRWRLTGEPIIRGKDGRLMNGQHRLHAVIDAGVAVPMVIVEGVDDKAFFSIDQGMARKPADVVGIEFKHRSTVASALRYLWMWREFGPEIMHNRGNSAVVSGFTNEIAVEMARNTPLIHEAAPKASKLKVLAPPASTAFCYVVCAEKSKAAADEFFNLLESGEGLHRGNPIHTLRQRLITERSNTTAKVKAVAVISMILRAWNAWRQNESLAKLYVSTEIQRPV